MVSLRFMYSSGRALLSDGPRGLVSEWWSIEAFTGTLLPYKVTVWQWNVSNVSGGIYEWGVELICHPLQQYSDSLYQKDSIHYWSCCASLNHVDQLLEVFLIRPINPQRVSFNVIGKEHLTGVGNSGGAERGTKEKQTFGLSRMVARWKTNK